MLEQDTAEALSCHTIEDIIRYLEEEGYHVFNSDFDIIDYLADEGYQVSETSEGLHITDQQLGVIHMLAYSGQREEAIKEIVALVAPAITLNTKVL